MVHNESILAGCDETSILTSVVRSLNNVSNYNCITATRISDLVNIAKSIRPSLIILSFRNNQLAIDHVLLFSKELNIPILCLTKKAERDSLYWSSKSIVFTQPIENAIKSNYLAIRVRSILLLLERSIIKNERQSFADQAINKHFRNRDKNLSRYVMELDQKRVALNKVKDQIKDLYSFVSEPIRYKLISIVSYIKVSTKDEKHWEDFKIYFENTSPNFLNCLSQKHPELSPKDIKYCCYLKMNMSNNDICHVLGINLESVRTHKYRLKKRMEISKSQNLQVYIKSIAS